MQITTVGIDLAKNVFSLHGCDARGKPVLRKQLSRRQLLNFVANLPRCIVVRKNTSLGLKPAKLLVILRVRRRPQRASWIMKAGLSWLRIVGDLVQFLCLGLRSRTSLAAENLFLRKQLAFHQERKVKPRRLCGELLIFDTNQQFATHR